MNSIFHTAKQLNGSKQELVGFDPKYHDIVDYILKITHEIWEERGIGVIYDTYAEGITLFTGATTIHGINSVVAGTMETLHGFPDRRLVGEAVVWSAEQGDKFYTSHRIGSTATNLGNSAFGPPTGKKAFFRTIADCVVSANKIEEEWLVRDNLHLIQQLGYDPVALAKQSKRYATKPLFSAPFIGENRTGQFAPIVRENGQKNSGTLVYNLFQNVWNARYFNQISDYYHPTATVHGICEQDYRGVAQIQGFLINLFASIPQGNLQVERVMTNAGDQHDEVAVRWRLTGLHSGNGFFGTPSGKAVDILGISHFVVIDGKIKTQWDVFDAFDVLCQIHATPTAATETAIKPLSIHDQNKALIAQFIADTNAAIAQKKGLKTVLNTYFSPTVSWNGSKPFDELKGTDAIFGQFWEPLLRAFPDLSDEPYILMAGHFQDKD